MHVLNWVHPCRALNNALSLLPLAHVTGSALHKAPVKIGYCSPRAAAGQLLQTCSRERCRNPRVSVGALWWLFPPPPIAAVLISLAPYSLAAALLLPKICLARKADDLAVFGASAIRFGGTRCSSSSGIVCPHFLGLRLTLGYFSFYLQIQADSRVIFCIVHCRVTELKFCSDHSDTCNQKNVQLPDAPHAQLYEDLTCSHLSVFK